MKPVQKNLFFRYFRKLNHGKRITFRKRTEQKFQKNDKKICVRGNHTLKCFSCALQQSDAQANSANQKLLLYPFLELQGAFSLLISSRFFSQTEEEAYSYKRGRYQQSWMEVASWYQRLNNEIRSGYCKARGAKIMFSPINNFEINQKKAYFLGTKEI